MGLLAVIGCVGAADVEPVPACYAGGIVSCGPDHRAICLLTGTPTHTACAPDFTIGALPECFHADWTTVADDYPTCAAGELICMDLRPVRLQVEAGCP